VNSRTAGMLRPGPGIDLYVTDLWSLTRRLVVDLGRATAGR
jgi:hypothetical protein